MAVAGATAALTERLTGLLDGAPEPDRRGRVAGWVTERFNEWPEGSRDAALVAQIEERVPEVASAV